MNYEVGTNYSYFAIKRKSRLQLRAFVGKWNEESCLEFWREIKKRFKSPTSKNRFNVCTDGNKQNLTAFQTVFPKDSVNYAKVKKIKKGNIVIRQIKKNVLGSIPRKQIGIQHVDGYCKRLRERVSRYNRRSSTFSKKKTPFYYHLLIFEIYNDFIDFYKDKKTPCMIEGITSRKWDWEDVLMNFYHSK